jgi:hypothetical protein
MDQLKYSIRINGKFFLKGSFEILQVICYIKIIFLLSHVYLVFIINKCFTERWLDAAQVKIMRLQVQGKVIFYQPYVHRDKDPRKQPFVVVIQDEWMRDVIRKFFYGIS